MSDPVCHQRLANTGQGEHVLGPPVELKDRQKRKIVTLAKCQWCGKSIKIGKRKY